MANVSPNSVAPWLLWGDDLQVSQNGSIVLANGWNQIEQRILRRLLTNPLFSLHDGEPIEPGYIFDINYGLGMRRRLGEPFSNDLKRHLTNLCTQAVIVDEGANPALPPEIEISEDQHKIYVSITVYLKSGAPGRIVFSVIQ